MTAFWKKFAQNKSLVLVRTVRLDFLPAAKRHGQGKVWVGIVLLLLLHQTIVSLVCFSFIFAMCVGILGQHGTVPKLSRSFTCNFYLQIFTCKFYLQILLVFQDFEKKSFLIFLSLDYLIFLKFLPEIWLNLRLVVCKTRFYLFW